MLTLLLLSVSRLTSKLHLNSRANPSWQSYNRYCCLCCSCRMWLCPYASLSRNFTFTLRNTQINWLHQILHVSKVWSWCVAWIRKRSLLVRVCEYFAHGSVSFCINSQRVPRVITRSFLDIVSCASKQKRQNRKWNSSLHSPSSSRASLPFQQIETHKCSPKVMTSTQTEASPTSESFVTDQAIDWSLLAGQWN